jgi:hypothetical protein
MWSLGVSVFWRARAIAVKDVDIMKLVFANGLKRVEWWVDKVDDRLKFLS